MGKQQEEEEKKDRAALLIQERKKIIYNLVLVVTASIVVVIGLLTMAWFAMNRENATSGMGVRVDNNGFELQVSSGTIGFSNLYQYLDSEITGNSGTITNTGEGGQVISWRMADGDDGVKPGAQGELEFSVISGRANLNNLRYSLGLTAFEAETHTLTTTDGSGNTVTTEIVDGLTPIVSPTYSGATLNAANFINGHVLFFTGRSGTTKDNYKYYGFINIKENFNLVLNSGSGTIYWIWPNTLGQITLDATDTGYISGTPVLDSSATTYATDRANLTTYLKTNAATIFSGSENYGTLIDAMYAKRDGMGESGAVSYKTEFDKLSEGYNAADQTIGNYVDYVLVHMIVSGN